MYKIQRTISIVSILIILVAGLVAGCTSGEQDKYANDPSAVNVSGMFTMNDQPLPGATVEFVFDGETLSTTMDKQGFYSIHLPTGRTCSLTIKDGGKQLFHEAYPYPFTNQYGHDVTFTMDIGGAI